MASKPSSLSKLNLALIVLTGFIAYHYEGYQNSRLDYLMDNDSHQSSRLDYLHEFYTSKYTVDFSVSEVQPIDDVFLLARASQKKHLTGVEFSGRVINTQSTDREDIVFSLSVDEASKELTINKISSGNSTGFSVYIPDIGIERARYAQMHCVRSRILYRTE